MGEMGRTVSLKYILVLPDFQFAALSLASLHDSILMKLVYVFGVTVMWRMAYLYNVSPLHPRIDTTDKMITMMTNGTIPAAKYMYIHRSSLGSGSKFIPSAIKRSLTELNSRIRLILRHGKHVE